MTIGLRTVILAVLIVGSFPVGSALAQRGGNPTSGGLGGGVGAAGTGSAAVGGGPAGGLTGSGAMGGAVGGGAPGRNNPAGNGAAGAGNPTINSHGVTGTANFETGIGQNTERTISGSIGGAGVGASGSNLGGAAPGTLGQNSGQSSSSSTAPDGQNSGQSSPSSTAPDVKGIADQTPISTVGLAVPGPDGSTKIVPARPCSAAARETDGTSTCVGIPKRHSRP